MTKTGATTALLVGLVGSLAIWVATPYAYFVIGTPYVGDCYLPVPALFLVLLLVWGPNVLLRRYWPRYALSGRQLALAFGMMLMACVLPGQGLLGMLPYSLAKVPYVAREDRKLASAYEQMRLPASLFPDRIGYLEDTKASEHFITELPEGAGIPWAAWLPPLFAWGAFMLFCWLMMLGLSLICLPQWFQNERLVFPLLHVERALVEEPEEGRAFAALFRSRGFWLAAGAVFVLRLLAGFKVYYPDAVPAIPLNWNLSRFFTEEPLRYLPWHIRYNQIYFIFVGAAFFMPNRMSFSVWFFAIAYAASMVIGNAYLPPFYYATISDHRMGAMFPLTLAVLWLGRRHWGRVFSRLFRRAGTEEDERERNAGWMFLAGCAGMLGWMLWIGVELHWAVFYVFFGFMISLLISRLVAETGMPFIRLDTSYQISLVRMAPLSWLAPVSLYFSYVMAMLFPTASRVSCATMSLHAIGLDERATPRQQWCTALLLGGLLVVGFVVCGAAHLHASYHHSMTMDGREQPISPWGTGRLDGANRALIEHQAGQLSKPVYNQVGHVLFGAALAGVLQWLCLLTPRWPLHPIGLLMVETFYSNEAWASVFIGWLLKLLILKYGGARLYRAARPVFMGLIIGEVLAAVFWALEPVVRVLAGLPYIPVKVLPW